MDVKYDTWISVDELLPEECDLPCHIEYFGSKPQLKVISVFKFDIETGRIGVTNRYQQLRTGNPFIDTTVKDEEWHWAKHPTDAWEPTHWLPIPKTPSKYEKGESVI